MWNKYFRVIKIVPGRVKTPRHGIIDLSKKEINLHTLRELHDDGWPYIELTEEGRRYFSDGPEPVIPEAIPNLLSTVPVESQVPAGKKQSPSSRITPKAKNK